MREELEAELAQVRKLAFVGVTKAEAFIKRFYGSRATVRDSDKSLIRKLRDWIFVPFSLWPIDVAGVGMAVLDAIEARRELDASVRLMIEMLPEPPSEEACNAVAEYEHAVKEGSYESLIHAQFKFDSMEDELGKNPQFKADWERIRKMFEVEKFCNAKGVIRRRMVGERNFRPKGWKYTASGEREVFENVFDAFCYRYDLYGMMATAAAGETGGSQIAGSQIAEKESGKSRSGGDLKDQAGAERAAGWHPAIRPGMIQGSQAGNLRYESGSWRPLLLKLTVNVTPYGTLISVPRYWSFDPKRDLKWGAVTRLHRVREVKRQGPKLTPNLAARRAEKEKAQQLWAEATRSGMKGGRRMEWVMERLGWDLRTDESRLRRLLGETSNLKLQASGKSQCPSAKDQ